MRFFLMVVVVLVVSFSIPGCTSSKKLDQFPGTIESEVEAIPAEPDRIEYIDVRPWTIQPGQSAAVAVRATADRRAEVVMTGVEGEAKGTTNTISLSATEAGQYTGSVTADSGLPVGKYQLEARLTGGPTGEPATLVSSRPLIVAAPPPPPARDDCKIARDALSTPGVYFGFDKSDVDETSMAWLKGAAEVIAQAGDRIVGVEVVGHCDERGTIEYNLGLGARRAASVRDVLMTFDGMSSLSISTVSKGEEEPAIAGARTEAEHAKNRRVEIRLTCKP